jgi:hypothetical protein
MGWTNLKECIFFSQDCLGLPFTNASIAGSTGFAKLLSATFFIAVL